MIDDPLVQQYQSSKYTCFALLFAAMIHDYEHPGTDNAFEIESHSEYALQYNDISVLENHHVSATFILMTNPQYNIFRNIEKDDLKTLRKLIISLVLSTDMSTHYDEMTVFKLHFIDNAQPACNDESIRILYSILLHSADVSNPTRPKEVAIQWAEAFAVEQLLLGDKRKNLGLPLGPFMDRNAPNAPNVPKTQIGFITYIVKPLFELINTVVDLHEAIQNIDINLSYWNSIEGQTYKMEYSDEDTSIKSFKTGLDKPVPDPIITKVINVEEV